MVLKGFIPKARFDEVNNEKKKLELDVHDRDSQLETLKNSTGDVEALKKQITDLQADNKKKDEEHAAEVRQLKIDAAVDAALASAKAKNTTAVKALLKDLDKVIHLKVKEQTQEALKVEMTAPQTPQKTLEAVLLMKDQTIHLQIQKAVRGHPMHQEQTLEQELKQMV